MSLRAHRQVGSLGEVLSEQTIGVLIGTTLPWTLRIAEVDINVGRQCKSSMIRNGVWDGERLISENWIKFVRTLVPATAETGNFYGGQWWLVPDDRNNVPKDAYSRRGNAG